MAKNNDFFGCLVLIFVVVLIVCGPGIFITLVAFDALSEAEMDGEGHYNEQSNLVILSEEGEDFYNSNKGFVENDLIPAGGELIHWTILAAIYEEKITENNGCQNHWLGPMKLKEVHWISDRFFKEHPEAQTEHSFLCGDIRDDFRDQITDVKTIEKYLEDNKWLNTCLQEEEENEIERFCRPYGMDADEDKKADPTQKKDALTSAAFLIYDYVSKYKGLANSLYYLYGADQDFLRKVKNRVLSWINHSEPSSIVVTDGILGWPLSVETAENKNIIERFEKNKQGITIQSKEDEPVKSLGWSYVEDVDEDESCGKFVKISHQFANGGKIFITYCHLKERSVEKGMHLEFDEEIGKVGTKPLHIQITEMEGDESQRVDPEIYLTPPNDVDYSELKNEDRKESEE